jgi:hypothetical protein
MVPKISLQNYTVKHHYISQTFIILDISIIGNFGRSANSVRKAIDRFWMAEMK